MAAQLLVVDAVLWDGTGRSPQRRAGLRVEGERIAWVGPMRAREAGRRGEDRVLDAAGRWLLPGLIDLHVHLTLDPTAHDLARWLTTTSHAEMALLGARHARAMVAAGFTAARDLGGWGYANIALKRAIASGWLEGPRLATAGHFLTVPGGHADFLFAPHVQLDLPNLACGAADVARAVREQVKRGADWIKVLLTGGVMTAGTPLGAALWDDGELAAAVSTARRLGRPVAAHCHGADGIRQAVEAGVATIEHASLADEAAVEAMARHGTVLVPTFSAVAGVVAAAKAGTLPPEVARQALEAGGQHSTACRMAIGAGVQIALGTDTGVPGTDFSGNATELAYLVDHGMTAEQALLAATRDAAAALGAGWSPEIGTLQAGKLADFLLVTGDPLEDVAVLASSEHVAMVVQGGRIIKAT